MNKATASETHAYSQLPPRYSDERGFNGEAGPNPASPLLDPAVNTEDGATATDLEDDFKYGVSISQSDVTIRMAFIRKVYAILLIQIVATTAVSATFMTVEPMRDFIHANTWLLWVSMLGSIGMMIGLFVKRRSYPLNFYLLGAFTLLEAYTVGNIVTYYDTIVVIEALIITLGLFAALTLFTFQTKYDFMGMAPYLYGGLWMLIITGFMAAFFPYSRGFSLVYSTVGALIFSGYIIFDTQMIIKHLNYEEYIVAAVSLYLDLINLFLQILRLVNQSQQQ